MSDYPTQPPPSTGTHQPPSVNQGAPNLPATGSDIAPMVGLGLIVAAVGAAVVTMLKRSRRDPWADAERARQREWDRMAVEARKKGATEYRMTDGKRNAGDWRPLP